MPTQFSWRIEIKKGGWFDRHGKTKVERALVEAGNATLKEFRNYPNPPPVSGLRGTYLRTYNLKRYVTFRTQSFRYVHKFNLHGPRYGRYLLAGTGLYGPNRRRITAKSGWLVWKATNPAHPRYGKTVSALSVKGMIWRGKRQAMEREATRAFKRSLRGH